MTERRITIRDEAFGCGFDVQIIPPMHGADHDREFDSHERARLYASGLQGAFGFPINDLVSQVGELEP